MCAKRHASLWVHASGSNTFSHHRPREVVTLDRILHSPLCLPIRYRDKYNTHNEHISDKHTLMTVCVRSGTPLDSRPTIAPVWFSDPRCCRATPFSFRCGHATSTSHRIKFMYNILMFATVFVQYLRAYT
jgi:hypothetical protein